MIVSCVLSYHKTIEKKTFILGDVTQMKILVINAGSSSLKYQFMDSDSGEVFAKGLCERIGIDGRLTHKVPAKDLTSNGTSPCPPTAKQSSPCWISWWIPPTA